MNLLAYIICPDCGKRIGDNPDGAWALLLPLIICAVAMAASKHITGKWIP
jgi:hypothetical protein